MSIKKCASCLVEKQEQEFPIADSRVDPPYRRKICKSCYAEKHRVKQLTAEEYEKKKKYEWNRRRSNPIDYMLSRSRQRARSLNLEHTIKKEDITIPEYCPIFGIKLVIGGMNEENLHIDSPSLDRIDNNKGYVPGNVVVISHRANQIKNVASLDDLRKILSFYERYAP